MEVEHVTGVGLSPRGAAQEERHLAERDGLLGEDVVEDDGVHAVVAEVLADSAAGVRGEKLERGGVGGTGAGPSATVDRFWPIAT